MNTEKFLCALGKIDESYINEAEKYSPKKQNYLKWGAAAACLCLVLFGIITVQIFKPKNTTVIPQEKDTSSSDYSGPITTLSAAQAGEVFSSDRKNDGTNRYTTVYAPKFEDLNLTVPEISDTIQIYNTAGDKVSKTALDDFSKKYLSQIKTLGNITSSKFTEEETKDLYGNPYYSKNLVEFDNELMKIIGFCAKENDLQGYVTSGDRLKIKGEYLTLLESDSENAIFEKLKDTIGYFNDLFKKDYSKIKTVKEYDYDRLLTITVYIYNDENTSLPKEICESPLSDDYITLEFCTDWGEGRAHHWNGTEYEAFLTRIEFHEKTCSYDEYYVDSGTCRMLSIKEAEEMLKKGYVFGGHSCPLCMAAQPEVDFSDYDGISLEYISGEKGEVYPFYAFYKSLGVNKSGMTSFAKTYVCAARLSEIDEYFESQKAEHSFYSEFSAKIENS